MGTLVGIAILIADIWAIALTLQSPVSAGNKALWFLVIVILPVLGLILWIFLGPRPLRK